MTPGQDAGRRAEEVRMDAMRQAMAFCDRVLGWRWREATPLHIQQAINAAVAEAVKERDAEIARLRAEVKRLNADYLVADVRVAVAEARREERESWNRTKPIDAPSVCSGCGGPHPFDTSVPSVVWNRVIRDGGLPDYLCTTCIVRAFALVGESFTATLWSPEFNGLPIHVMVRDQVAADATAISEENTRLRAELYALRYPPAKDGP